MILPINLNLKDLDKFRLDKKTVMSQVVDIFFENSNQKTTILGPQGAETMAGTMDHRCPRPKAPGPWNPGYM